MTDVCHGVRRRLAHRSGRATLALALLIGCLMLAACGHQKLRGDEENMGLDAQDSPGDLYVAMAAEYLRRGQMDAALRRAMQAVDEDAKNPRSHYVLALVYQAIGQTDRADQSFKRAVEISPKNPNVRNAYGSFFCSQGRYTEADAQFAKALENPLYSTPWITITNSGMCAAKAGNRSKAETEYRRALNANPRFGPALVKMAAIEYERGNYKGAKNYLDRFFRTNIVSPDALALGIRTERRLGHKKTAATYEQVLRKNFPDAPQTLEL